MRCKWLLFTVLIIIMGSTLTGCINISSGESHVKLDVHNIPSSLSPVGLLETIQFSKDQFSFPVALVDDTVIYTNADKGKCTYYRYYIYSKETVELGTVNNFFVSNGSRVMLNDHLYFYVTRFNNNEPFNSFYDIDLKKNELVELFSERKFQTLVYLAVTDQGKILALKGDLRKDNIGTTYIEEYDPVTQKTKIFISYTANYSTRTGDAIINLEYNNGKIYACVQKAEFGETTPYLMIYNENGVLLKSLDLSEYSKDIFDTGIEEIKIMNDYVFIRNFSSRAFVGKIDDGLSPITDIMIELGVAHDDICDGDIGVFFERGTPNLFLLNSTTGKRTDIDFKVIDPINNITYIMKDKNNNLAIMISPVVEDLEYETFYYTNIDDLQEMQN